MRECTDVLIYWLSFNFKFYTEAGTPNKAIPKAVNLFVGISDAFFRLSVLSKHFVVAFFAETADLFRLLRGDFLLTLK